MYDMNLQSLEWKGKSQSSRHLALLGKDQQSYLLGYRSCIDHALLQLFLQTVNLRGGLGIHFFVFTRLGTFALKDKMYMS